MINSHYVPQFILRNFYTDEKITYCDLEKKTVQPRNSRSIFSEEGYYPADIEKDLCKKAEYQFANLYHNKLENARNNITLNRDELFTLKKFLIVSAVRYKEELIEEEEKLLEILGPSFKPDSERCLKEILECDTLDSMYAAMEPVFKSVANALDGRDTSDKDELNIHLFSEMKDILHSYIVFVKPRGDEKFLIPDIGRGYYRGPLGIRKLTSVIDTLIKTGNPQFLQLSRTIGVRDYTIYPLSSNLAILAMNSFFKLLTESEFHVNLIFPEEYPTVSALLGFGDSSTITPPQVKMRGGDREYRYEMHPITPADVAHLNSVMLAEAKRYVACSGLDTIQKSLGSVGKFSDRDYSFMKL